MENVAQSVTNLYRIKNLDEQGIRTVTLSFSELNKLTSFLCRSLPPSDGCIGVACSHINTTLMFGDSWSVVVYVFPLTATLAIKKPSTVSANKSLRWAPMSRELPWTTIGKLTYRRRGEGTGNSNRALHMHLRRCRRHITVNHVGIKEGGHIGPLIHLDSCSAVENRVPVWCGIGQASSTE